MIKYVFDKIILLTHSKYGLSYNAQELCMVWQKWKNDFVYMLRTRAWVVLDILVCHQIAAVDGPFSYSRSTTLLNCIGSKSPWSRHAGGIFEKRTFTKCKCSTCINSLRNKCCSSNIISIACYLVLSWAFQGTKILFLDVSSKVAIKLAVKLENVIIFLIL